MILLNRILRNTDPCMEFVETDEPLANLLRALVTNGKISLQDKVVVVPG